MSVFQSCEHPLAVGIFPKLHIAFHAAAECTYGKDAELGVAEALSIEDVRDFLLGEFRCKIQELVGCNHAVHNFENIVVESAEG